MTARAYNFCAGPATIAEPVLKRAQEELLDWHGLGMSAMEISHRSADFIENILEPAEANLRQLLAVPPQYKILFISAGATHQFSMVPLNLLDRRHQTADYFNTGIWSKKAIKEARRYGKINIPVDSEANGYTDIAPAHAWQLTPDASYIHYTPNETINGLAFDTIPETGDVPLVADMSSAILSQPIDVKRFGLIYAGAQKNIGPAGLTIVIIREDLLGYAKPSTPLLYNYQKFAEERSLCNTPATFSIYLAGLVFEWLSGIGGLSVIAEINARKAAKLYACIDKSGFYQNHVNPLYRSLMNVIFYLPAPELDIKFAQEASSAGLKNLKGHKLIGGIRASIYNAMPEAGVDALIHFMQDFEKRYG